MEEFGSGRRIRRSLNVRTLFVLLLVILAPNQLAAETIVISKQVRIDLRERETLLTAQVTAPPSMETITGPPRLVIDLPGVLIPVGAKYPLHDNPNFTRVRVGRHADHTRVVFDLKPSVPVQFELFTKGTQITIIPRRSTTPAELATAAEPVAIETPPLTAPVAEAPMPPEVSPVVSLSVSPDVSPAVSEAEASPIASPAAVPAVPTLGDLKFSINKLVASFKRGVRPIIDVRVKNLSSLPLFMSTSAEVVVAPGTRNEVKRATSDLLASPRRFEIKPDEERTVRLVLAKPSDGLHEQVFRVNFVPDAAPFELQAEATDARITTGIAMLVIEEPSELKAELVTEWTPDGLRLTNNGTTNILLERGRACVASRCMRLATRRLYPGNSWTLNQNAWDAAEFLQKVGEEYQQVSVRRP